MSKRKQRKQSGLSAMGQPPTMSLNEAAQGIYGFEDIDSTSSVMQANESGNIVFGSFTLTSLGFEMPSDVSLDEYGNLGDLLFQLEGSLQWLIGDYAVHAKEGTDYGETYTELLEKYDRSYSTISKWKMTCEKIPFFRRRKNLGWSHHTEIAQAELTDEQRWDLLDLCDKNEWSVRKLREMIADEQGKTPAPPPTPLENVSHSVDNTVLKARKHALKSDDRAGWVNHARKMAEKWQALADELENSE